MSIKKTKTLYINCWGVLVFFTLLLPFSCSNNVEEVNSKELKVDSVYSMLTRDVDVFISDSGKTKYRLLAKEWYVYEKTAKPYWFFPKGFYTEQVDEDKKPIAKITSDTAYYYFKDETWIFLGGVSVFNLDGDNFKSNSLVWKKKDRSMSSEDTVTIQTKERTLKGSHFVANQDFTQYTFYNSKGAMLMKDKKNSKN